MTDMIPTYGGILEIIIYNASHAIPCRYIELIQETEQAVLKDHCDVVLCTCNETCSRRFSILTSIRRYSTLRNKVSQVIIDECGMANEPETIAAASICDHVVLIGDHKQLQPVVKYNPAKECGLARSLFQRYADNEKYLVKLDIQYRMVSTLRMIQVYITCLTQKQM